MTLSLPQNPGIGGLVELTSSELALVQSLSALGDPGADRILFWDESANAYAFLTAGTGLSITGTTITATGTIDGSGTTNELSYWVDSNTLGALAVATYPSLTEISYVKGVTSALQTQLNAKQPLDTQLTAIAALADAAGVLTNDGAGNMSWAAAGAGANTALSNLASVAINTTLVSDTDNTDSLGTLSIAWSDLFLGNGAVINFTSSAGVSDVTLTHSSNLLTLAGGDLALGTNNLTLTGSIGATGARATKVWTTDLESTNMPTVGGVAMLTISSSDTLSNKTLTAPKFADLGFIADANGNELIILDTVTSAVNEITLANAATGNNPNITASGGDANVGIDFTPKGTGFVQIRGNATQAATLALYEDTDDGSNYSAFRGSARSGNIIYTMPTTDPTAGQVLSAGAPSGNISALSWTTTGGANSTVFDPQNILYKNLTFPFIGNATDSSWSGVPLAWAGGNISSTSSVWYISSAGIVSSSTNAYLKTYLAVGKIGTSNQRAQYGDNKKIYWTCVVRTSGTTGVQKWGLGAGTNSVFYTNASTAASHAMFSCNGSQLASQTSDGVSSTSNNITATITNNNQYQIVSQLSTNVLFYLNGVLQFTHTTNLPTGAVDIQHGFGMNTGAVTIYADAPIVSVEL